MGSIGIANSLAYAPNFQKGLISAGKMNRLFNRKPKIHDPVSLDGIQPKWVNPFIQIILNSVKFFFLNFRRHTAMFHTLKPSSFIHRDHQ